MSLLATVIRALARRLPQDERRAIGLQLGDRVTDPDAQIGTLPTPTRTGGENPDWSYVWNALIDACGHAGRVEDLLSDKRAFFDFEEITRAAAELGAMINRAYELMCTAPWLDGLTLDPGADLRTGAPAG